MIGGHRGNEAVGECGRLDSLLYAYITRYWGLVYRGRGDGGVGDGGWGYRGTGVGGGVFIMVSCH